MARYTNEKKNEILKFANSHTAVEVRTKYGVCFETLRAWQSKKPAREYMAEPATKADPMLREFRAEVIVSERAIRSAAGKWFEQMGVKVVVL